MLDIVAPHNDELPISAEFKRIDDIEAARALALPRSPDFLTKQQPKNIKDEQGGEQKRDDCSKQRERLC